MAAMFYRIDRGHGPLLQEHLKVSTKTKGRIKRPFVATDGFRTYSKARELEPCKAKTGEEAECTDVHEHYSFHSPFGSR
jgi:hypothetical protein